MSLNHVSNTNFAMYVSMGSLRKITCLLYERVKLPLDPKVFVFQDQEFLASDHHTFQLENSDNIELDYVNWDSDFAST